MWDAFIRGGKNWDTLGLYLASWGACAEAEDIHENTLEIHTYLPSWGVNMNSRNISQYLEKGLVLVENAYGY